MYLDPQNIGQSLWIGDGNRTVLADGTLLRHISERSVSGAILKPQSVSQALQGSDVYDRAILQQIKDGSFGESLLLELILDDVRHAADLLRSVFDSTDGVDGWVSVPVSPLQVVSAVELLRAAISLHARLQRPNVLVSIPGYKEFSEVIEELVFRGIPVNISLICSHVQYIRAAEAYIRGIERRMENGLNPVVSMFASVSLCPLAEPLEADLTEKEVTQVTIAIARKIYKSMRMLHTSQKWERAYNSGAQFFKIIWGDCFEEKSTKYMESISRQLVTSFTVLSIPEIHMEKFVKSRQLSEAKAEIGDDCDKILMSFQASGIEFENMAESLQKSLVDRQVKTWITLLDMLAKKSASLIQD